MKFACMVVSNGVPKQHGCLARARTSPIQNREDWRTCPPCAKVRDEQRIVLWIVMKVVQR